MNYEIISNTEDEIEICINNTIFANEEEILVSLELDNIQKEYGWGVVNEFLDYFQSSASVIKKHCLTSIYDYYCKEIIPRKSEYENVFSIKLNELDNTEQIDALISLGSINLFANEQSRKGFGLIFSCDWDEEHGVGVRFKDGQIIEVAHADIALR